VETLLLLLLLFPLATAAVNALAGGRLPRRAAEALACAGVLGALAMAAAALILAGRQVFDVTFLSWIRVGGFRAAMSVHYDPLAAVMALMVTFVASLIHLYSVAFMREDEDYRRYFCYLNFFVFAMLVITLADNLLFVYLGWEGVGFCSYALIGFWYRDPANATAGRKAFMLTRIGDVGFGVALALFFYLFQNLSITHINAHAAALSPALATTLALLLLWAAAGKSAQLPLTVWLPDAMRGPTPVSALIHAATMVTAGVYLLMRLFPLVMLSPLALKVIAGVGAVTALYAGLAACVQWDVKKSLAYSTISQVGYMVLAVGAADIVGGMFHLLSHAFFKALLFMAAGVMIQALAEEHNIFKMGNLRRLMPGVALLFLGGSLCLSAFPLLGGFFSKDRILLATFLHPEWSYRLFWGLAALGALLTPFYSMRLYFVAFRERPGGPEAQDLRRTPKLMVWVLWPLVVLALFDGLLNLPGGIGKNFLGHYLAVVPGTRPDLGAPPALEWVMGLGSAGAVVLVTWLTYAYYRRPRRGLRPWLNELLFEAFYLDRLYLAAVVRPCQRLSAFLWRADEGGLDQGLERLALALFRPYRRFAGFLWTKFDELVLDQALVRAAEGLLGVSRGLGFWTTGRVTTYLKMLLLGLTGFLVALALRWYGW
jgi:NADH-quinone oxidoreductase subunit L